MASKGKFSQSPSGCKRQGLIVCLIVILVLAVDQASKFWIKTNMTLSQTIDITSWFKITFVENNGMAFGMELFGKLFLSVFRIGAIGLFIWYIAKIRNKGFPTAYIVTLAFILAGAVGNLIDCIFYGLIFSESTFTHVAAMTGFGQGYAPALYGKVVDMLYFPLFEWPEWMPLAGGRIFFSPVFNVADSCITCGMIALILFFTKYINMGLEYKSPDETADAEK
ncbi:MAG: lipoprotein signal peptidase [Bacteroidaceae bacterium]|nr:lipoprotein signal peptidase [Bacteroidaceae bacterium]